MLSLSLEADGFCPAAMESLRPGRETGAVLRMVSSDWVVAPHLCICVDEVRFPCRRASPQVGRRSDRLC